MEPSDSVELSVVVPVFNSAAMLPELMARLVSVLDSTAHRYEVVLVDDNSRDDSWDVLGSLREAHPGQVTLVRLMRNFGQHNALMCGFRHAREAVAVSYPAHDHEALFGLEERSFWFRHRNRCVVDLVRRFAPAGALFDIGAGNGFVSMGLAEAGFEVVPVEPGEAGARNARARGLDPVVCASLATAGFIPGCIAAAGLFDVLEHIEDDAGFLAGLHAALQPGARLYLTVPACPWLFSSDDVAAGHFRRYTLDSLASVLAGAGFKTLFRSCFFSVLPLPVLVLRTLPYRLRWQRTPRPEGAHAAHRARRGWLDAVLRGWLDVERRRLARGRAMPFGSSCLAAAERM